MKTVDGPPADLLFRRMIPWPSLFGADSQQLRDEDVMGRRRAWYWRKKLRLALIFVFIITSVYIVQLLKGTEDATWWGAAGTIFDGYDAPMIPFPGDWNSDSRICLKGTAPYPATVAAIVMGVQTSG